MKLLTVKGASTKKNVVLGIAAGCFLIFIASALYLSSAGQLRQTGPTTNQFSTAVHTSLSSTSQATLSSSVASSSGLGSSARPLAGVSGKVTATGQGTRVTKVTFNGSQGSFFSQVSNGHYSIDLPSPATYDVTADWAGAYSWQSGTVTLGQFNLVQSSPSSQDFQVQTPDSEVTVSGTAVTNGQGTHAVQVAFIYDGKNYSAKVENNTQYSMSLPNLATYSTSVSWIGAYPWQVGSLQGSPIQVSLSPGSSSLTKSFQVGTPNSMIAVAGSVVTTGSYTNATNVSFTLASGKQFSAKVSGGQYSVQLPNLASYAVQVEWIGAYQWQSGSSATDQLVVKQGPGASSQGTDLRVPTPNSIITVSGNVFTTGSRTKATLITFVLPNGQQFPDNVISGQYQPVKLPNTVSYQVQVVWTGAYPWQTGTSIVQSFGVNQTAGSNSQTSDVQTSTPNSDVVVSGSVSMTTYGTHATQVIFSSSQGMQFTAQVSSAGQFTISLPNLTSYAISVAWQNSNGSGSCSPTNNQFNLQAGPGVTSVQAPTWSC